MTLKQIRANRLNAQECVGPRSHAGKGRSRMNALKSRIYAQAHVLPGEDSAAPEKPSGEFYDHHQPETPPGVRCSTTSSTSRGRVGAIAAWTPINPTPRPPWARPSAPPAPDSSGPRAASTPPAAPVTATSISSGSSKPRAPSSIRNGFPIRSRAGPRRPTNLDLPTAYQQCNQLIIKPKLGKWFRFVKKHALAPSPGRRIAVWGTGNSLRPNPSANFS